MMTLRGAVVKKPSSVVPVTVLANTHPCAVASPSQFVSKLLMTFERIISCLLKISLR